MKIISSSLGMDAATVYTDVNINRTQLTTPGRTAAATGGFELTIPDLKKGIMRASLSTERSGVHAISTVAGNTTRHEAQWSREQVVGSMVSEILGQKADVRDLQPSSGGKSIPEAKPVDTGAEAPVALLSSSMQVSLSLERIEYRYEKMEISTAGTIVTSDGREVCMQLQLHLEREEVTREAAGASLLSSRFIDPLVLSFSDGITTLEDSTFCFDLNCDGDDEQIGRLRSGSGFLVLDKNGDGCVNDGKELFGPLSGAGYDELRMYDKDGNNWIDENDPVFGKLQLWLGADSDDSSLVSLKDAGGGALSLASVDAHFNLKARDGRILGQVDQAGLFLMENGEARPLAEIDLAVADEDERNSLAGFSVEVRKAIELLSEIIAARRRRMANPASVQIWREGRAEERHGRLVKKLWELQLKRKRFFT